MNGRICRDSNKSGWRRIRNIVSALAVTTIAAFSMTGCGGGSSSTPAVEAPGIPTNFTVVRTPETTLSATLEWSLPLSGGDATSFEIYRSTTAGTTYNAANHLLSIPVVAGKTTYTFIDDVGLIPRVDHYWVVAAKNAGGQTPTAEVAYIPIGSGGGGDTAFGNNFSAALIFADGYGISGLQLDPAKTWTTDVSAIDFNTGLRPLSTEVLPVVVLPYLDPASAYILNNVTYYRQKTASTWQGQWVDGSSANQHVNAAWGDNLISQALTVNSVIRIETVLTEALTSPMTSYTMVSLYGTRENEVAGTDGTTYENSTAFVFAANAHLTVQKLDGPGGAADGTPLFDQPLWTGDGPGFLAGEVNVLGNFTYGFVWNLKNYTDAGLLASNGITTGVAGTWRLTFSLDATSPVGTSNNTFIDTVSNGVRDSATQVHIDINVNP